jgi:glycosyltransferase involved in cell wall biosynthesis
MQRYAIGAMIPFMVTVYTTSRTKQEQNTFVQSYIYAENQYIISERENVVFRKVILMADAMLFSKRILHVLPSLQLGGIEKGIAEIYEELAPLGYQFDFLVEHDTESYLADKLRELGGHVYAVGKFKSPLFIFRFLRHLKRAGPYSAVHSHCYYFSGLVMLLAFIADTPYRISHIHSANRAPKNAYITNAYYGVLKFFMRSCATNILAVSAASARCFAGNNWAENRKIALRPMGIDFDAFTDDTSHSTGLLRDLGIGENERCLVHVGRFTKEKNQRFALKLFDALRQDGTVSRLVLIGEGPLKSIIEEEAAELVGAENVVFTGERHDCPALLAALRNGLFIFPSLFEGFGLAAVEAQLAGLGVLASRNVPAAVGVVPHYFERLSLAAPVGDWEIAAKNMLAREKLTLAQRMEHARGSGLSVQSAAAFLKELYG